MCHAAPQALLAGELPDLDHAIRIAAGQQPPGGTKGRCPELIMLLIPDLEAAVSAEIPQPDRPIITACCYKLARWMHNDRSDPLGVALQGAHAPSTADLPHPHQPIVVAAEQQSALRVKSQRPDQPDMARQYQQRLAVRSAPNVDFTTHTAAINILTISPQRHG